MGKSKITSFVGMTEARDYLFGSSFLAEAGRRGQKRISKTERGYDETDKSQTYSYNSCGYRGPEFSKNVDILCAGDSHSFGMGLPEGVIWPTRLSQEFNECSYANLGYPGGSVHSIVADILHYIRTYGSPKNVVALFPELDRFLFFSNPKLFIPESRPNHAGPINTQLAHLSNMEDRPKYSKKPFTAEDITPNEHAYMMSFQYIHILEDICDAMGINLVWSFWDSIEDSSLISKLQTKYPGKYRHYINLNPSKWGRDRDAGIETYKVNGRVQNCHKELLELDPKIFHFATDRYPHHDGSHRHLHTMLDIAEYIKL